MTKEQIEQQETTATGFTSFGFSFSQQKQRRVAEEQQSKISVALVSTISQPKEPTLFDNIENDVELQQMRAVDEQHLINRGGKPTYLTHYQTKIIFALGCMLSKWKDDEEYKEFVEKVDKRKPTRTNFGFPVSITELTKLVNTEGKARSREKLNVIKELKKISEIVQVQTIQVPNGKGDLIRLKAPLIILKSWIEDLSPDKRLDMDFVEVEFSRVFFSEIRKKYAVVKTDVFKIWGKNGSGTTTELFTQLFSDLLGKYTGHRNAAIEIERKIRNSRKYKTEEGLYKAINKAQREALTYREKCITIRSRVTTDYESTRKQRADFSKHLDDAIEALKKIGLIKEATYVKASTGEEAIDFVFNFDYYRDDTGDSLRIE